MYSRNILVVGLWYPSNQMLKHFCSIRSINPEGWKGKNWKGLGFNVYSYFPEFTDETRNTADPGPGEGEFEVDYQDIYDDFQLRTQQLRPIAIITFTRNPFGTTAWELEGGGRDRSNWIPDKRPPYTPDTGIGPFRRTKGIPAIVRTIWNAARNMFFPVSERTRIYSSNLPLEEINRVFHAKDELPTSFIDTQRDLGGFISEYLGILAMNYRDQRPWENLDHPCLMAGHIHVGHNVSLEKSRKGAETVIELSLKELKKMIFEPQWIGWIGLDVKTAGSSNAGTTNKVTVDVIRDGKNLFKLNLDAPDHVDMQRGSSYFYSFKINQLRHDKSTPLPDDVGRIPHPYPPFGVEFSHGIDDHCVLRFKIDGDDAWRVERVDIHVKEWRQVSSVSSHHLVWELHPDWIKLPMYLSTMTFSKNSSEGKSKHDLKI